MGEYSLIEKVKEFFGNCGWKVFLWSRGWTEEQYIKEIKSEIVRSEYE